MSQDPAPQFVLASASPRREALLRQLGLRFVTQPANVPEVRKPGEAPADYALRLALDKACKAQAGRGAGLPLLGADTDVVIDDEILGKPLARAEAVAMLLRLAGRSHRVFSAVALVQGARRETALTVTEVDFAPLSAAQAAAYWDSGEPAGKAGAYAIQGIGGCFVRAIRGSYSGVVGLPLCETLELLARFGIPPESRAPGPESRLS